MNKDAVEWTLESWASGVGLTEASVAKLKEQEIANLDTLCALVEEDVKDLNLNVGQMARLHKALQQIHCSEQGHLQASTTSLAKPKAKDKGVKDRNLKELLPITSMKADLLPSKVNTYKDNACEVVSIRPGRHKALRVRDFITKPNPRPAQGPGSSAKRPHRSRRPWVQALDMEGNVICHNYQSASGCKWQVCSFSHVCIIPGCGGPHPSSQHNMLSGQIHTQVATFMPPTHQSSGFHGRSQ